MGGTAGDIIKGIAGAGLVVAGAFSQNPQLIMMGGSLVVGSVADALTRPRNFASKSRDIGENKADPMTALPVIYGEARVGINAVFRQTTGRSSGDPNNTKQTENFYLYLIGALCVGPVYGVHEIYIDGNLALDPDQHFVKNVITFSTDFSGNENHKDANDGAFVAAWVAYGTDGQMTIEPKTNPQAVSRIDLAVGGDGSNLPQLTVPTNHPFKPGDMVYLTGALRLTNNIGYSVQYVGSNWIQLGANYAHGSGTETATVDFYTPDLTQLFPSQISHQHRGDGITYLVLALRYDQTHFPNGLPKIEACVRGRALHDPRSVKTLTISAVASGSAQAVPPYDQSGVFPTLVTTSAAHGFIGGEIIVVSGSNASWFNGNQRVGLVVSSTEFIAWVPFQSSGSTGSIDVLTQYTSIAISTVSGSLLDGAGINYANIPFQQTTQIVTSSPHGLVTNDIILISGHSENWLNGTCRVAQVLNPTTFNVFVPYQGTGAVNSGYSAIATSGSGGQINCLPYASNPALAMRDYLTDRRYGAQAATADINDPAFEIEANYCDQTINIPNSDPGVGPLTAQEIRTAIGATTGQTTMYFEHGTSGNDFLSGALISGDTFVVTAEGGSGSNGVGIQHIIQPINPLATVSIYRANGTNCGSVGSGTGTIPFAPGAETGGMNPHAVVYVTGNLGLIGDFNFATQNILTGNQVGSVHQFVMSCSGIYQAGDTILISGYSLSAANGTFTIQSVTTTTGFFAGLDIVNVTMNPGASGAGGVIQRQTSQRQYMINGAVDCGKTVKQNVEDICSSYRASLIWQGGQYRTWTRRAQSLSGIALDETNIVGDWSFMLPGQREIANVVRAGHYNRRKSYQADYTQWPDPLNTNYVNTFLADDNNQLLLRDIELPLTNEHYTAQTVCMIVRAESRTGMTVGLTATDYALQCQVGDIITVTHDTPGWAAVPFWVQGLYILESGHVRLNLLEYNSNAYVLEQFFDESLPSRTTLADPLLVCDPPTNLAVTHTANALAVNLVVTWTPSVDQNIDHYEIQYEKTTDTAWTAWGRVSADISTVSINGVDPTLSYNIQVRAVNDAGAVSDWVQVLNFSPQSPSTPLTVPTITDTIQTEAGNVELSEPIIILSWPLQTNAYYARMEFSVTALGGIGAIGGNAVNGPVRITARWNTQYTIVPAVVSINGTITTGTPFSVTTPNSQAIPRNMPFTDSGFSPVGDDPIGLSLNPAVKSNDGTAGRSIIKGLQIFTVDNGAAITYNPAYQVLPTVEVIGGINHEGRALWGTQAQVLAQSGNTTAYNASEGEYDDSGADNQTTNGCTVRALLRQPGGSLTPRSVDFPNPNSVSTGTQAWPGHAAVNGPESAGLSLGTNLPANNDQYTVNVKVEVTIGTSTGGPYNWDFEVDVDISTNSGSSWATVGSAHGTLVINNTAGTYTVLIPVTFTQSGLTGSTNQVRFRAEGPGAIFAPGLGTISSLIAHGCNPTQDGGTHGATWNTASSTVYASKTPDPSDTVTVKVYTT